MIDLKTLYEQSTMYCNKVDTFLTDDYYVEVFHQLETPLYVYAFWHRKGITRLHSITYTIKENK